MTLQHTAVCSTLNFLTNHNAETWIDQFEIAKRLYKIGEVAGFYHSSISLLLLDIVKKIIVCKNPCFSLAKKRTIDLIRQREREERIESNKNA